VIRKILMKHLIKRAAKIAMLNRPEIEEEFEEKKETFLTSRFYLTSFDLLTKNLLEH